MNEQPNFKIILAAIILVSLVLIIINYKSNITDTIAVRAAIPYWDQERAYQSFKKNAHSLDYINLFWYYLNSEGEIATYEYATENPEIIQYAHENNVKVIPILTNLPDKDGANWSSERVENVIKNRESRQRHIQNILDKLAEFNFDGIDIDYEQVEYSQKENFTLFIKELALELHKNNKLLIIALHPKTKTASEDSLGAFQDWEKLAEAADYLSIMSYGEHWAESDPGPIASIKWLKKISDYSSSLNIPKNKINLGIPLYGLSWKEDSEDSAQSLTFAEIQKLITTKKLEPKWDTIAQSPYLNYSEDDNNYKVWFESTASVKTKIDLAKKSGFGGIYFWRLGGEDPELWKTIELITK